MVFGVFDGHGGKEVAAFCKENIQKMLQGQESLKKGDYASALRDTFMQLDDKVKQEDYADQAGTTACVLLVTKDRIFCANSGDSRAVLSHSERGAIALSDDHKPQNTKELARIEKSGHCVDDDRVDGNLALSRAIGDFQYKDSNTLSAEEQAVTCSPDISERARDPTND